MQARLMRHCCIVFPCFYFLPHKPRLHALGPIVLCVSAIYKYGVYSINRHDSFDHRVLVDSKMLNNYGSVHKLSFVPPLIFLKFIDETDWLKGTQSLCSWYAAFPTFNNAHRLLIIRTVVECLVEAIKQVADKIDCHTILFIKTVKFSSLQHLACFAFSFF